MDWYYSYGTFASHRCRLHQGLDSASNDPCLTIQPSVPEIRCQTEHEHENGHPAQSDYLRECLIIRQSLLVETRPVSYIPMTD
jgi:hypothetical protein